MALVESSASVCLLGWGDFGACFHSWKYLFNIQTIQTFCTDALDVWIQNHVLFWNLTQHLLCVCKTGKASEKKRKSVAKYIDAKTVLAEWSGGVAVKVSVETNNWHNSLRSLRSLETPRAFPRADTYPCQARRGQNLYFPIHLVNKSQALVRHQQKTWLRGKSAQPWGFGRQEQLSVCLSWLLGDTYKVLLGHQCFKCSCTHRFSFRQGLLIVGINPGLPLVCLSWSYY